MQLSLLWRCQNNCLVLTEYWAEKLPDRQTSVKNAIQSYEQFSKAKTSVTGPVVYYCICPKRYYFD